MFFFGLYCYDLMSKRRKILNNEWNDKESNDAEEFNDDKENYDSEGIENAVVYILTSSYW